MSWFLQLFKKKKRDGLYYESKTASILWNNSVKVSILKWKKRVEGNDYRNVCKCNLDLLLAKSCMLWYENREKLGLPSNADMQWFHTVFTQDLIKNGIYKHAILISKREYDKKKYEGWLSQLEDNGVHTRYFCDKKEAVKWLIK
jgi:hypothetical protein